METTIVFSKKDTVKVSYSPYILSLSFIRISTALVIKLASVGDLIALEKKEFMERIKNFKKTHIEELQELRKNILKKLTSFKMKKSYYERLNKKFIIIILLEQFLTASAKSIYKSLAT